jgi:hypothetical protein
VRSAYSKHTGAGLGQQADSPFPQTFREAQGAFFFEAFAGLNDQSRHAVV